MYVHIDFGDTEEETNKRIQIITDEVQTAGFSEVIAFRGQTCVSINCIGDIPLDKKEALRSFLEGAYSWVINTVMATSKFKLMDRSGFPGEFRVKIDGLEIGGKQILVIAGPCAVESRDQIIATAQAVKEAGAHALRGGAFKPRTSPWSFQGLGEEGLHFLAEARALTGLPIVTEAVQEAHVKMVARVADMIQTGMRNAQNYGLLELVSLQGKPILYKRGESLPIEIWLQTAEYMVRNNQRVVLCCRGTIGYNQPYLRNNADIDAVIATRALTHHPVFFDPSHACGRREFIVPIALAAIAAGADGLLIEVHPDPKTAKSDREQQLTLEEFAEFMVKARLVAEAVGRTI